MDFRERSECISTIRRIETILETGILADQKLAAHPLRESAFIDFTICLRDLLSKVETHAARIDFTDDVQTNGYIKDVTDLITAMRDSCCHINSFKRSLGGPQKRGSFNTAYSKIVLMRIDGVDLSNDYNDDIAYFYGANRLYLKRQAIRAFEEAKRLLHAKLQQR